MRVYYKIILSVEVEDYVETLGNISDTIQNEAGLVNTSAFFFRTTRALVVGGASAIEPKPVHYITYAKDRRYYQNSREYVIH